MAVHNPHISASQPSEVLAALQPRRRERVYDLLQRVGLDVSDWANYKKPSVPAANPKYCYEWSFTQGDQFVVLNLWHASLTVDGDSLACDLNMRADASEIERAQDEPWRSKKPKPVWAKRARAMDQALQLAWRSKVPVHVIVCEGTMRDLAAGDEKASEVKLRSLDPAPWTLVAYDWATGQSRLRRSAEVASAASQPKVAAARLTWPDWVTAPGSLSEWQSAAEGLGSLFGTLEASSRAYDEEGAYWIEIRRPLPGVHLISFKLEKFDLRTKVILRLWVESGHESVYKLFAAGPRFVVDGNYVARSHGMKPSSSFQRSLDEQGVQVTGVWYSVELEPLGFPGSNTLRTLFESFCRYAVSCHNGELPSERSAPIRDSAAPEWDADERLLAEVDAMTLSQTEKLALVRTRINQSGYRDRLLARWEGRCSITGLAHPDFLIASHIVPWSACTTPKDRWSPDNGLLLPPGLDKAFEVGLIGFDAKGKIILSKRAERVDIQSGLGISRTHAIRNFHVYPGLAPYLERHRQLHADTLAG